MVSLPSCSVVLIDLCGSCAAFIRSHALLSLFALLTSMYGGQFSLCQGRMWRIGTFQQAYFLFSVFSSILLHVPSFPFAGNATISCFSISWLFFGIDYRSGSLIARPSHGSPLTFCNHFMHEERALYPYLLGHIARSSEAELTFRCLGLPHLDCRGLVQSMTNPHSQRWRQHRRGQPLFDTSLSKERICFWKSEYLSRMLYWRIAFFLQWRRAIFFADSKHIPRSWTSLRREICGILDVVWEKGEQKGEQKRETKRKKENKKGEQRRKQWKGEKGGKWKKVKKRKRERKKGKRKKEKEKGITKEKRFWD